MGNAVRMRPSHSTHTLLPAAGSGVTTFQHYRHHPHPEDVISTSSTLKSFIDNSLQKS